MLSPTDRTTIQNLAKSFIGELTCDNIEKECLGVDVSASYQNIDYAEHILYVILNVSSYSLLTDLQKDLLHYRMIALLNINFNK